MKKKIFINQCGYYPEWEKHVTFLSDEPVDFEIRKSTGATIFKGKADHRVDNTSAREINYTGDFSAVKEPGVYYVYVQQFGESDYFTIGEEVYDDLIAMSEYFFYLQRCGMELDEETAGAFAHLSCHDTPARIYNTDKFINVNGGWHDAGDYGRYIVPGAMTVAQLLMAYQRSGRIGDLCENPAEKNVIPAYLQEIKYELDWMMKMQNDEGELYHKVTCASFCGFVMPEDEKDELIISPVSVTATADFAAATAMAVKFFEPYDVEYAKILENVSKKAYSAMKKMDIPGGFLNPEGIVTGQYEDACDKDERYWAAAELYKAFGDECYREDFEQLAAEKIYHGYGWVEMGSYGNIAYLTCNRPIDEQLADKIRASIIELADTLKATANEDGYQAALKDNEYIWGSNLSVCCNGIHMYDAYKITGDVSYLDAAREQLHYILGRNPMGLSYVTGCGTDAVLRPHHRPSGFVGMPMPGMLSGGPCDWNADIIVQNVLKDEAPAKCFVDMTGSYSTNEVTIYWNSAMILMIADIIQ